MSGARRWSRLFLVLAITISASSAAGPRTAEGADGERTVRGQVVDETGLPLPGATVELERAGSVVATAATASDESFALPSSGVAETLVVTLAGFEPARIPAESSTHVVLTVAHASASMEVTAEEEAPQSPSAPAIGIEVSRQTLIDMPAEGPYARDILPLLPSVVRAPDGTARIDGARPAESAVRLDGFDVSDPATGRTHLDLPAESITTIEVLDDPADVSLSGFLGGIASMGSRGGGERREAGFEGFIPRPRLSSGGTFKRIDGFSPRAYVGGALASGRVHYFTSDEVAYERAAVPDVTDGSGHPDSGSNAGTFFGRLDAALSPRNNLTSDTLVFPYRVVRAGLSPLVDEGAAPDVVDGDVFEGVTDRQLLGKASVLTVSAGLLRHEAEVLPNGNGEPVDTPSGLHADSFAALHRTSSRDTLAVEWEHAIGTGSHRHEVGIFSTVEGRRLDGRLTESPYTVVDDAGQTVRTIVPLSAGALRARDDGEAIGVKDLWHLGERIALELGARLDRDALGGRVPSARAGFDLALDRDRKTVLKVAAGRFVGQLPLAVPAFASFPVREDSELDAADGALLSQATLTPRVGELALPRATAGSVRLERRILPRVLLLASLSERRSTELATVHVPEGSGPLLVVSDGHARYWASEVALQGAWGSGGKLFASYVRSSSRGSVNDFGTLFTAGDTPYLEPVFGSAHEERLPTDARDRWLAWGTLDLPHAWVLGPTVEWHSGFPYSVVDVTRHLVEAPGSRSFPAFFSVDVALQKWITFHGHRALIGVGMLNLTGHENPRDVVAVEGGELFGTFTNSLPRTLAGAYTLRL